MCKPILLIGMMGCGKSTIGRLLAGRMGLPLIDLDEEIARAAGKSIPEIFAEEGDAGFRLHAPDARLVNFAAHRTTVTADLAYENPPAGMWELDRYVGLLMGEVPRLTDDPEGYGPAGRGFIAHVDVPEAVRHAHSALEAAGVGTTRVADSRWATAPSGAVGTHRRTSNPRSSSL